MNSQYITKQTVNSSLFYQINHPKFTARIAEFGAQLLSFIPFGQQDILWLSNLSPLDGSKPIRGGVPLCWPWFGPAQNEFVGEPQHGYIRSVTWSIDSLVETDSSIELVMQPNVPTTLTNSLGLSVKVRYVLSDDIKIELITSNISTTEKALSQAIHTYFTLDNIDDHKIIGLSGLNYLDKLDNNNNKSQDTDVVITQHTDRVYLTSQDKVTLVNANKKIDIGGVGHDSIVVWNPWQENAKNMEDFDNNGYKNMICIEMANTQNLVLPPKAEHKLMQFIKVNR